jgi:hypothetical protein
LPLQSNHPFVDNPRLPHRLIDGKKFFGAWAKGGRFKQGAITLQKVELSKVHSLS